MKRKTCLPELGRNFTLESIEETEHEEIGTFAGIEISQNADTADQKVKVYDQNFYGGQGRWMGRG